VRATLRVLDFSSDIKKCDAEEIVKAAAEVRSWIREDMCRLIPKHPRAASSSFMRDIRERYVPEFHPRNFCDRVAEAPFTE
jgi:hypothetical protein